MNNAIKEDALHVSISASGDVYFRSVKISRSELTSHIREGLRAGSEKKVYVIADARARYEDIRPVLTEISLAGVEQIALITR
jgi:biopolymer transport protein ExbD